MKYNSRVILNMIPLSNYHLENTNIKIILLHVDMLAIIYMHLGPNQRFILFYKNIIFYI